MKKKKSVPYVDGLMQRLKDPEIAVHYLNACLEDDSEDAEAIFLLALRDVAKAHGISRVSSDTKLARDSLYKALSKDGNPTLSTLNSILDAIGLKIEVKQKVS